MGRCGRPRGGHLRLKDHIHEVPWQSSTIVNLQPETQLPHLLVHVNCSMCNMDSISVINIIELAVGPGARWCQGAPRARESGTGCVWQWPLEPHILSRCCCL